MTTDVQRRYTRPCVCGCGGMVKGRPYRSQLPRYINGHEPCRSDHKGWTDAEIQFLRDNYDRLKSSEMAVQLGRSRESVKSYALKILGLRKGGQHRSLEAWYDHYTPNRPENGCWEWTGTRNKQGYGTTTAGGRFWLAHRLAMHLALGGLPKGLDVLHRCDNQPCANPAHLYLGTDRDNQRDRAARGGNPLQRLTPAAVIDMRRRFADGLATVESLASEFDLSRGGIKCALDGRSWGWLENLQSHLARSSERPGEQT